MKEKLKQATKEIAQHRSEVIDKLVQFAVTDMLLFWGQEKDLIARQEKVWAPIIAWSNHELNTKFITTHGLDVPEQHKTLKGAKIGEKTVYIEGMMCDNCRKHVEKQLDKIDGAVAHADWKKGIAIVSYDRAVSDDAIRQALAWTDYKVTSIEENK